MSRNEKRASRALPSQAASVCAAVLALLLTGTLLLTTLGVMGLQVMTSRGLHTRAALSADAVDLQMEKIRENIQDIAEEYHFEPQPVLDLVDRESVEILDQEVVAWWTDAAANGAFGEEPEYPVDGVEDTLRTDQGFMDSVDPQAMNSTLSAIELKIGQAVVKSAVLFRDMLVQAGVRIVGQSLDLPELTALVRKIPLAAGSLSLLLAGLIALVMSRNLLIACRYIGSAVSACGLLWLVVMGLAWAMNLGDMIREASPALSAQFTRLSHTLTAESLGIMVICLILGGVLMALAGREYRQYE